MKHDDMIDAMSYAFKHLKGGNMGCDIHWYSETKKEDGWACDQAGSFQNSDDDRFDMDYFHDNFRDYRFFGLIQPGVRTEWDWSFPERIGIPEDLSVEISTILKNWGSDGHSYGYLTLQELEAKIEELKPILTENLIAPSTEKEVVVHHMARLVEIVNQLKSENASADRRIIFWFDN